MSFQIPGVDGVQHFTDLRAPRHTPQPTTPRCVFSLLPPESHGTVVPPNPPPTRVAQDNNSAIQSHELLWNRNDITSDDTILQNVRLGWIRWSYTDRQTGLYRNDDDYCTMCFVKNRKGLLTARNTVYKVHPALRANISVENVLISQPGHVEELDIHQFLLLPKFSKPFVQETTESLPYRISTTYSTHNETTFLSNDEDDQNFLVDVDRELEWGRAHDFIVFPEPQVGVAQGSMVNKGMGLVITDEDVSSLNDRDACCYFVPLKMPFETYRNKYPYLSEVQLKEMLKDGKVFHWGKMNKAKGKLFTKSDCPIAIFTGSVEYGGSGAPVFVDGKLVGIIIGSYKHNNRNLVLLVRDELEADQ